MPVELVVLITNVRSNLEESTAKFWTDTELTTWINNGCKDIARRAEVIQSFYTALTITPGTATYTLPGNVIRIHRMEFAPTGQNQVYPIALTTEAEMDNIWGINMNQQSSYPLYATMWGTPGVQSGPGSDAILKLRVFPVPSQVGTVNIYYYRTPYIFADPIENPTEYSKNAEIPEGWDDLVVLYCEYEAKRKDRNPLWKEAKDLYEEKIAELIDVTRKWHDQSGAIQTPNSLLPSWLYSFED